jgi:hypothetical protein
MFRFAAVVITFVLVLGGTALGDERQVTDGIDVAGPMDLASASHGHENTTSRIVHSLVLHQAWGNEDFIAAHIRFWLPDGDRRFDRRLLIVKNVDGSLAAGMTSYDSPSTPFRGYANAYRSDERSLEVVMPAHLIARGLETYKWKAFLFYDDCEDQTSEHCSGYDTHTGRVEHRMSAP